jgi:hypothetical protein
MTRRIVVGRRYQVLGLLLLLSGLYWLAVWAWVQSAVGAVQGDGVRALQATLHANALALQATWAWVIGAVGLHGALALIAARRRDREALVGVGGSAILHALLFVSSGVIAW